jgi:osmotically-inducible protein OsmY
MAVTQVRKMSPQDESVYFKVRIALKVTPETESFYKEIKIAADRGIVTLDGVAPSAEAVRAAERAASTVPQVLRVINNLTIS